MSTIGLPPLDFSQAQYNHTRTGSVAHSQYDGNPRSPGCPRGFESLLAPISSPSSGRAATVTTSIAPVAPMQQRNSTRFSSGDINRGQLVVEEQAAGMWDRLAMIEGRRYNINSYLIREDRKQCRELLARLNLAAAGSLSSLSYLILELFKLKPLPGPASPGWEYKFGELCGSKGDNLSISFPFRCEFGYNIHVGNNVEIGSDCYLNDASVIKIGNNVRIGKNVKIDCNLQSKIKLEVGVAIASRIEIGDDVVIGDNVTIVGGITIGAGSRVCANILLTESIGEGRHLMIYSQSVEDPKAVTTSQPSTPTHSEQDIATSKPLAKSTMAPNVPQFKQALVHHRQPLIKRPNQAAQLPMTCDPYATSTANITTR